MKVTILGGGPSAAFAYKAAVDFGRCDIEVLAERPVYPQGAFYLHWLPDTVRDVDVRDYRRRIIYSGMGDARTYAFKMWGDPSVVTSFPTDWRQEKGYSADVLHALWQGVTFRPPPKSKMKDNDVKKLSKETDLVIQTFPTQQAMRYLGKHRTKVPILYRAFPETSFIYIQYNGERSEWTRMTIGNRTLSFEFPANWKLEHEQYFSGAWSMMEYPDLEPETKPNFTPPAPNVLMVGRYATWDRTALAHEAYAQVSQRLETL